MDTENTNFYRARDKTLCSVEVLLTLPVAGAEMAVNKKIGGLSHNNPHRISVQTTAKTSGIELNDASI